MYNKAMKKMLKKIPKTMTKPLSINRLQKFMTEIGGGWYMQRIANGIPTLRRKELGNKAQQREIENLKLYEYNKWWNDQKFKLHWHKLEWVNPRNKIKRKQPYSVSSKQFHI